MAEHYEASTSAVVEGQLEKQITFREIIQKFDGDFDAMAAARQLVEWGLVPGEGKLACTKCGQAMSLSLDRTRPDGLRWICDKRIRRPKQKSKVCGGRREFRTGTFFAGSHLPLWKILAFGQMWANGVALNVIGLLAEIKGQDSLVDWASFCREVVICEFLNRPEKLGGEGKIVEIDESKFGKRKYNRGHAVEGQWVFGGYERGSGRVFMVPVENRSAETLVPLIKKWILPGTTIHSDFWKSYDRLEEHGYVHMKVNHLLGFKDDETGVHTNCVESSWRAAKSTMAGGCRSRKHIAGNLARYMFMKRCRAAKLDPTSEFSDWRVGCTTPAITTWRSAKNCCDQSKKWASANRLTNTAICWFR